MASGWQNKLVRVSRMDWAEVRVRAAQEIHKQSDLLLHRIGVGNSSIRLNGELGARPRQSFFSGLAGNESSARAELLRTHLPDEASAILRDADEICARHFRLLGYENLSFALDGGNEIDWHLDPVHGKCAPLDPWFKIPFLDFAVVGDHKIIWELSRHQHLVTLAKARLLSGDEKYTRELIAQWHSWIKSNPYPLGINWGSSLEVAFRSLSWIWVDQLLAEAAGCSDFRAELAPALAFHGRYIERYLSTYFSPNTHLLGEALALFFLGTLYPQMPAAGRWKKSGWQILLQEAERQVRADGVYFEQSLHYHVYALDFFLYARLLATRAGLEVPREYDDVLGRMLDLVAALAQAGPAEGFGDDDGGRLWNPQRNRTEHMTDPLALGTLTYSREFPAARLTEEAIWLFGSRAVEKLSTTPTSATPRSLAFPHGGLYVLADSNPFAQSMTVDAGPQGVGRSGHGHADALSLRLTLDGRRWLVDSGSGVYISKDRTDRNIFRGTGAHNTMRVDGVDQAVPDEPFSWTNIPVIKTESWVAGTTFSYFVGSHDGYARLADPVVHRRHVLNITGGLWMVRDVVIGRAKHELEIRWHFASDLDVRIVAPDLVEVSGSGSESNLRLIMPEGTIWDRAAEVSKTVLSPAYGAFQPAPLIRWQANVMLPTETAAALLVRGGPLCQERATRDAPKLTSMTLPAVQVYELDYHHDREGSHGFFFALGNETWTFGPWSSNARMLYCRIENEKLAHLVVIGGTQVAWQGQDLVSATGPCAFFEWRRGTAVGNAAAGDFSLSPLFEQLTGETIMGIDVGGGSHSSKVGLNRNSSSYAEKQ